MIECGSLEYALARLQARHGERADETVWRRLEVVRDLRPLLELARDTALGQWLVGITADSGGHRIEQVLRSRWRERVAEVASWMPARWRAPVLWCATLPDLPVLQHLARGGEPPRWMHDDREWRELALAPQSQRSSILRSGPLAPFAVAWPAPHAVGEAWLDEWRRRLPGAVDTTACRGAAAKTVQETDPAHPARRRGPPRAPLLPDEPGAALALLVRTIDDHRQSFAQASASEGWLSRAALRSRLSLLLRRVGLEPAAAFIHLALWALELERLRAELLRRVLFAPWKVA